jgi:glycosyltransferase involved in cell wall biosynthesis
MPEVYGTLACLLSTSAFEGFPNTFLEAWSHGVPVVSTIDPDRLIANRGLGFTANNLPELIDGLKKILSSQARWCDASKSARRYYAENHAIDVVMPRVEQLFLGVTGRLAAST